MKNKTEMTEMAQISKTNKIFRKLIREEISKTKTGLTKKELFYKYMEKITALELFNLIATFSRIFVFFIGILRFIEHRYILGVIFVFEAFCISFADFCFFIHHLKVKRFDETLEDNVERICMTLYSRLIDEGVLKENDSIEIDLGDLKDKYVN